MQQNDSNTKIYFNMPFQCKQLVSEYHLEVTELHSNLQLGGYKSALFRGKHFVKSFNPSFLAEM